MTKSALFAAICIGFAARLLTLPLVELVESDGRPSFFGGPDAYYHYRRAELAQAGRLAEFDAWSNFPEGVSAEHLPRAYSHLLGLVLSVGGSVGLSLLPVIAGSLAIVALSSLASKFVRPGSTIILYAMMPAAAVLTSYGAIDHHCVEALFLIVAMQGRVGLGCGLIGAILTTPTWPVVLMTGIVSELLKCRGRGINYAALIVGPFGLLIAGRSYFSDPWLGEVKEMQPLLGSSDILLKSFHLVSLAVICLPAAMISWWRRRSETRVAEVLAAALVTLPLALLHARFVVYLAIPGVIAVSEATQYLKLRFRGMIATAFATAVFVWALAGLAAIPTGDPDPSPAIRRAMEFLRRETPSAGDPLSPETRPAYGIVASWDLGHALVTLAERPAIASPFHTGASGRSAAQRILFSEPEEANRIADQNSARYLFLTRLRIEGGRSRTLYERLYLAGDTGLGWRLIYPSDATSRNAFRAPPSAQIWECER